MAAPLRTTVLGPPIRLVERWYGRRPMLTATALLGAAMVVLMTAFSWQTGLGVRQWVALAGATLLTAWLCVWIVFLEEEE